MQLQVHDTDACKREAEAFHAERTCAASAHLDDAVVGAQMVAATGRSSEERGGGGETAFESQSLISVSEFLQNVTVVTVLANALQFAHVQ